MQLILLIGLLDLATKSTAATVPSLYLVKENSSSTTHPENLSLAGINNPSSLNSSLQHPPIVNPRFTYEARFVDQILDQKSAYLNTLVALSDLSTKGWTQRLRWEAIYSLSSYGDVTIRIHASQNPSSLEYRHAIWGLYSAIRATTANNFRACVLTLYWSPIWGKTRHVLGYVSILGPSSPSIDASNSTEDALELLLPQLSVSPKATLAGSNHTVQYSTSLTIETADTTDVTMVINFENVPLKIDWVFQTIYTGLVYLASMPQSQAITEPGVVNDEASHTFLRWDCTHIEARPNFEYRFAIAALMTLPIYMYDMHQFQEARFTVYVDESEVGRGWLYRQAPGEASSVDPGGTV